MKQNFPFSKSKILNVGDLLFSNSLKVFGKLKPIKTIIGFFLIISTYLILNSYDQIPDQTTFQRMPPIITNCYIQKLATPLSSGENLVLFVKYLEEENLPEQIELYDKRGSLAGILKDDGVSPDISKGDFIYSIYIQEDISSLLSSINGRYDKIQSDGGVIKFTGHAGEWIPASNIPNFDLDAFNNFQTAQIYLPILDVSLCATELKKENSLFITDLNVIEDAARTYNCYNLTGNINGAWTIQTIIKNIVNKNTTGVDSIEFLKKWVESLIQSSSIGDFAQGNNYNNIVFNNVVGRLRGEINSDDRIDVFLGNWIRKARQIDSPTYHPYIDSSNWEVQWDSTNHDNLWRTIPFRLMAIVNRIDLADNIAYGASINNAGETRFIFTLVNPFTGKPIEHPCIGDPGNPGGTGTAIDWVGMNVIFEFANPFTNPCDLQNFAQQWYDLSSFSLSDPNYHSSLEDITNQVIAAGAGPNRNFNESNLNQIRTNEKMFSPIFNCASYAGFGNSFDKWLKASWELRQFDLNSNTGFLTPALLTNTPVDRDIEATDYLTFNCASQIYTTAGISPYTTESNGGMDALSYWIFGSNGLSTNRQRVVLGNHKLPDRLLDGTANIYAEYNHYFDYCKTGIQGLPNIPDYENTNTQVC